jgi:hypothetical protein
VVKPTAETAAMEASAVEATAMASGVEATAMEATRMATAVEATRMATAAAMCCFGGDRLGQYENASQSGCSKAQPACYPDRLHVATPLTLPPPKRRSCENDWQRPMARSWPEDEIELKVSVGRFCCEHRDPFRRPRRHEGAWGREA